MSPTTDRDRITAAVRLAADAAGLDWPPAAVAPVPLDRLIAAFSLTHAEVAGLTRAAAAAYLAAYGIHRPDLLRDATPLAGLLFANAAGGVILARKEDNLPRRRFSAAHELGHYLLHFLPRLRGADAAEASLVQDDATETICEDEEQAAVSLTEMERQANRFAAELLMPEEVCRRLWDHYAGRFGAVPRFVLHHVASDLLVSREAARWRLRGLGLMQ